MSRDELEGVLARAADARDEWRSMALADRQAVCERMVDLDEGLHRTVDWFMGSSDPRGL